MNTFSVPSSPTITLLTDFGLQDGFVGVMKGVILSRAPHVRIVDISHEIPPFDVQSAAFLLDWAFPFFPEQTVHTVVVDPGVGTPRDVLVFEAKGHRFLCPDNGVISRVWTRSWDARRLVRAVNRSLWLAKVSSTFHGRDIFAPLAAFLASGGDPAQAGPPLDQPGVLLPAIRLEFGPSKVDSQVCYVDRFGNLVTTIEREAFLRWLQERQLPLDKVVVVVGSSRVVGVSGSYAAVRQGSPVAVFDGFGRLEIAINQGRADRVLNANVGEQVTVCIP
jgi:hypothetical protein